VRHRRAGQDRDHSHPGLQRRLDLQPHDVVRVIETAVPSVVDDRKPAVADHHEQHVARLDRLADRLGEVGARWDRVDVLEHPLGAERLRHDPVEPVGLIRGVLPAVAQKDPGRHWSA
jgi:hypothetical protein